MLGTSSAAASRQRRASPTSWLRAKARCAGNIFSSWPESGSRGEADESWSGNRYTERGKAMEDEARNHYAFMENVEPVRVGFIRNGPVGCSPDSLVGERGGLELKTKLPHLMVDCLTRDAKWFPPEHKWQLQGFLWVAEREWIDLSCYWPKMPPFIRHIPRDEGMISALATKVGIFNAELGALVDRLRGNSDHLREALKSSVLLAG
jgi:hypothetical protein